jgi:hypothetical protein
MADGAASLALRAAGAARGGAATAERTAGSGLLAAKVAEAAAAVRKAADAVELESGACALFFCFPAPLWGCKLP